MTLTLRREALGEVSRDELAHVVGGALPSLPVDGCVRLVTTLIVLPPPTE